MDAEKFADKLCAWLIGRGELAEDSAAHHTLHAAFRAFYPLVLTEMAATLAKPKDGTT